jgi:hypothetical protein
MFAFIGGMPRRRGHMLSTQLKARFRRHFTKPQYENFCRVMLGLMAAGKGEHDMM